jgi:hypothetical protein
MSAAKSWISSDETPVRDFLARVCAVPALHARFLNTLSLLEHIGSRKIMMSQSRADIGGGLTQDTLRHLAEETRHAFFFKRAAEKVSQTPLAYEADEILVPAQARLYMGRLDAFIARSVSGAAAYLYMSLVVELRAVWFYRIYQGVLKDSGQPVNLTSLLAEEGRHLNEMGEHLRAIGEDMEARLPGFVAFEDALFRKILSGLERAVPASVAA